MNGSFSLLHDVMKQTEIADGIFLKLEIMGRGAARLYFIDKDGVQIDVPAGFVIRDVTHNKKVIMNVAPESRYFVLCWEYNYECVYRRLKWNFISQQEWRITETSKNKIVK